MNGDICAYLTADSRMKRQLVVLVNPLLKLEAADSEGWMRISWILYGLYLIFLRGGRLNQQRLSSGQSASGERVPHPLSPSVILHSAVFLCVFFIFNQIHVLCVEVLCICVCAPG